MQKGIKFRIYPNREQQNLINQTLGCCRLIYNREFAMRNEAFWNGRIKDSAFSHYLFFSFFIIFSHIYIITEKKRR